MKPRLLPAMTLLTGWFTASQITLELIKTRWPPPFRRQLPGAIWATGKKGDRCNGRGRISSSQDSIRQFVDTLPGLFSQSLQMSRPQSEPAGYLGSRLNGKPIPDLAKADHQPQNIGDMYDIAQGALLVTGFRVVVPVYGVDEILGKGPFF